MPSKNCFIDFENRANGVFFPGETMAGNIHLNLKKSYPNKALWIRISGVQKVAWSDELDYDYRNEKIYFKTYYNLGNSDYNLLEGQYVLRLLFTLPYNIPTSVESISGYTRYEVKVTIESALKNLCYRFPFTVIKNIDLNFFPRAQHSINEIVSNDFNTFGKNQGKLSINIKLPVTGFVPGQTIPIVCYADNQSSIKISKTIFTLIKSTTCRVEKPVKRDRIDKLNVVQCDHEGVDQNMKKKIEIFLKIPPLPPSTMHDGGIVKTSYLLKIKAKVSGLHKDVKCKIPLIIGTTPSFDHIQYLLALNPMLATPTYHVASKLMRSWEFAPLYPFYQL